MPAVVTCPQCHQNLQLPDELMGSEVRCPMCQQTFAATADSPLSAGPPPVSGPEPAAAQEEEFERPLEEDDGKKKRPRKRREASRYGTTTAGLYHDLLKEQRRKSTEHRGVLILVFGILAITCAAGLVGLVCAVFAYNMATNDLNEMYSGRMDRSGETLTKVGRILAVIGACMSLLEIVLIPCLCMLGALPGLGRH